MMQWRLELRIDHEFNYVEAMNRSNVNRLLLLILFLNSGKRFWFSRSQHIVIEISIIKRERIS